MFISRAKGLRRIKVAAIYALIRILKGTAVAYFSCGNATKLFVMTAERSGSPALVA